MKNLRWQILIVVITLVVVVALLLTQQPSATLVSSMEPASGGIYTEALVGSFGRLNPLFDLNNPADRDIDRLLFSSLFWFDSEGKPQYDLAESLGVTPDGMIYNITLRPNATWHDGMPVTSDDVIFTLNLLRSQFSAIPEDVRVMWDMVEIVQLDEKNIKFILPEPFAPFLDYLTFGVLPRHLLETVAADQLVNADFNLAPVGSGPYVFEELTVKDGEISGVVLKRSETYYGQDLSNGDGPYIDQIVFRYFPDHASALDAYQDGEVLGINEISSDILMECLSEPNLAMYSSRLPRLTMVLFNLGNQDKPFLQEKNVRRALMLAINRQWLIDSILSGQGIVANSPIIPGTWAYYEGVERLPYDVELAEQILQDAGYSLPGGSQARVNEDGDIALTFTMVHPDTDIHTAYAQAIQGYWAEVGVEVTLVAVPYETLMNEYLIPRAYDAALVDLEMSRAYDPDPYPFWHQTEATGGQNYSQWDNRSASEYLEQARVVVNTDTRMRLYRNFQIIFAREMPALPLVLPVYSFGVDIRVLGVQSPPMFEPADRFNGLASWFLVTRRASDETLESP